VRQRPATLAIALGAALLALAACDSGSAKRTAPSTTTTTAAATPAEPTCTPTAEQSIAPTDPLPPPGAMPAGTFMSEIQGRGTLRAGVSGDTLLFGFQNPENAQLEGFDIDLVHRIAQAIFGDPNRVTFRVMPYSGRIPALQQDQVDIVADVMTMNCPRWKQIDFSSQYLTAGQRVLVRSDSHVRGIGDLNGKRVCVAQGSTNQDTLRTSYKRVIAVPVPDVSDCMVLFQQGEVDAVTADDTVLAGFAKQDPYAKLVGPQFTSEPYGLGIKKTHPEFVQFVNRVLEQMRADGTWKQLYEKYLVPTIAPTAPNPPAAQYGR
jgi:polar amino acid transport system substrate-binding protein